MTHLTTEPIDPATLLDSARGPDCGAVVLFLGTVREMTGSRRTLRLTYEAYYPLAQAKLAELEATARQRWEVRRVVLVHRLGPLELGEVAVAVAVASPHRADAFEAARWLIDTLKETVPIWKQDHDADGARTWVHPGVPA